MGIVSRKTDRLCPECHKSKLEAVGLSPKNVSIYRCPSCKSVFDAVILHDFENRKHCWVGRQRNPKYWKLINKDIAEGIAEFEKLEKQGIPAYLKTWKIEEIK